MWWLIDAKMPPETRADPARDRRLQNVLKNAIAAEEADRAREA
ncbi:hypothetical protein [Pseudooceanicola marinus]|nr:hypothetical protein [Pseudooceanicola marinus]